MTMLEKLILKEKQRIEKKYSLSFSKHTGIVLAKLDLELTKSINTYCSAFINYIFGMKGKEKKDSDFKPYINNINEIAEKIKIAEKKLQNK